MYNKHLTQKNGVILIAALWIVAILSLFAVTIGRQASISLRLASYDADKRKAYLIARAGMMRALSEKAIEYKTGMSSDIDAFSQSWASNEELFLRRAFGAGYYTVGYEYPVLEKGRGNPMMLYGLMDEQSKININTVSEETLINLLLYFDTDEDLALSIAGSIIDWRDADDVVASSARGLLYGAENGYYQALEQPYACKNAPFENIYELLLVKGVTTEILHKIKPYITVYGNGMININTASEVTLDAIIGPAFEGLGAKIFQYRQGNDDKIGTKDDSWFSLGPVIVDRGKEGFVEIKNLQDPQWYANIYGVTTEEYNRIRQLLSLTQPAICVASETYRVIVYSEVNRVKVRVEAVYDFSDKKNLPIIKYWYQE
jgi:type II secretory pathway component PulK